MNAHQPLLNLIRGNIIESQHFGSIAVVDSAGKLLYSYGDPYTVAFLRSSAKPFQALPFVEKGGVEHFGFTESELAISCASHETGQLHLDLIHSLQVKVGIQEQHLQCGPHLPADAKKLKEVIKQDIKPTPNFNNCSGKHTMMLAFAKMRGLSLDDYLDMEHPIQVDILNTISEMCLIDKNKIELGVDGCSAINFAMPLYNAALGMARFVDPFELNTSRANACKKITSAMLAHPEMISNFGEFDCELMKASNGKVVTKRGAEGFQIVGVQPSIINERGVGIAFKVVDGDKSGITDELTSISRVRPAVTLEILRQLNVLNEKQLKSLENFGPEKVLKNYAGLVTGEAKPVFEL
ncbi:MAG TPA: L-asparaginase [Anaerolineae bacterium]|nr:L-asparaginase [Anaerolineae bacterium]